jgi:hypothetical protein
MRVLMMEWSLPKPWDNNTNSRKFRQNARVSQAARKATERSCAAARRGVAILPEVNGVGITAPTIG